MLGILYRVLFALIGTLGFAVLINVERKKAFLAGLGGAFSWLFYELVLCGQGSVTSALFIGSLVMGLYSEFMARRMNSPATIFYIPGFVPLVPGSYVYNSVLNAAQGNADEALALFFLTMVYSAAIALGLIVASALVAVYKHIRRITLKKMIKEIKREK